jgi:hypothetical protein
MSQNDTLESALTAIEREADGTVRAIASALRDAKKFQAAAVSGQLRDLRAAMESTIRSCEEATAAAQTAQTSWTFDEQGYFAGGAYTKEVLALAAEEGVSAFDPTIGSSATRRSCRFQPVIAQCSSTRRKTVGPDHRCSSDS